MNAPINGDKRIDIAKKPPNERPLFLAPLATTKDKISQTINTKIPFNYSYGTIIRLKNTEVKRSCMNILSGGGFGRGNHRQPCHKLCVIW